MLPSSPTARRPQGLARGGPLKNNQTIKSGRGGKRPGAGRKAGSPNLASIERQIEVSGSGETPLDFMLRIMRDPNAELSHRMDMAKAAARYTHPALSSIDAKLNGEVGLVVNIKRFTPAPNGA